MSGYYGGNGSQVDSSQARLVTDSIAYSAREEQQQQSARQPAPAPKEKPASPPKPAAAKDDDAVSVSSFGSTVGLLFKKGKLSRKNQDRKDDKAQPESSASGPADQTQVLKSQMRMIG